MGPCWELLNLAAGDEVGSSFRFLVVNGEEGILRLVFVASPRIRLRGTREVAMLSMAASNVGVVKVLFAAQTFAMSKFWRGQGFATCLVVDASAT